MRVELLDRATDLFAQRSQTEGINPRTMIALLAFYIMKRYTVDGVKDDEFYEEGVKDDFGPECVALIEEYVRTGREVLECQVKI